MLLRNTLQASSLLASLWSQQGVNAIKIDINDKKTIQAANKIAIDNAMQWYHGGQAGQEAGIPDGPYYWWQAGGLFGILIQRWSIFGTTEYNDKVTAGMLNQVGEDRNYEPLNQTKDLGNDDQVFWAFAAMDAAELGYPDPPAGQPTWTGLAQAVFNRQTGRWDPGHCKGGMRWQIPQWNPGYDYKNTMTNGGYFQLAARLARYTGNDTYMHFAERTWDWMAASPIFDNSSQPTQIWDGIHLDNCNAAEKLFWSYNAATLLVGSAYLYNYTNGAPIWEQRIKTLLGATNVFYVKSNGANNPPKMPPAGGQIMSEVACEFPAQQTCNQDQPSFKAYVSRWMSMTTVLAPFTKDTIMPRLQASATAAAQQCTGNDPRVPPGTACGRRWYQTTWDGFTGLGEHMSVASVFQSLLITQAKPPLTLKDGGTSQSDSGAGSGDPQDLVNPLITRPMTAGDKFGASVLTIISIGLVVGCGAWISLD